MFFFQFWLEAELTKKRKMMARSLKTLYFSIFSFFRIFKLLDTFFVLSFQFLFVLSVEFSASKMISNVFKVQKICFKP